MAHDAPAFVPDDEARQLSEVPLEHLGVEQQVVIAAADIDPCPRADDPPEALEEQWNHGKGNIPRDGVAPLAKILRKLADRGYAGPISVELFLPKFQQADPFDLAQEIKRKSEAMFKQAGA
jgi:sugar phosphate isomerase/epimerase